MAKWKVIQTLTIPIIQCRQIQFNTSLHNDEYKIYSQFKLHIESYPYPYPWKLSTTP